jgi:hypothetical protein
MFNFYHAFVQTKPNQYGVSARYDRKYGILK